ncbi:MAG TPA: GNAT family N-acetyltransferase [Jatrophihabitans sp.]|jgi:GNAT superfamily N-acetyltransferase
MRRYVEPARSYTSTAVLAAAMVIGFLVDLFVIGGGRAHAVAWVVGGVLIVGIDALIVHAARELRSIVITDDDITVGEETLLRKEIAGVELGRGDEAPVLGRRYGEGLPRGTAALTLGLRDGRAVTVATRHPKQLAELLGARGILPDVRRAEPDDLEQLPDIDRRAESLFRVAGMDLPDLPFPLDALHESRAVFVAGRPPVGFVQVDEVDGIAHVQELAVLPSHMRKGLGSALLDAACTWARESGYPAITLTTYEHVPWNGPFYTSRGFVELAELTPELFEIRDWERDVGLDAVGRRIAMRRDLTDATPGGPAT